VCKRARQSVLLNIEAIAVAVVAVCLLRYQSMGCIVEEAAAPVETIGREDSGTVEVATTVAVVLVEDSLSGRRAGSRRAFCSPRWA
jgi:hypothetical protein